MREILFIFFQTNSQANGGVRSMANIALNLNKFKPIFLTQKKSELVTKFEHEGYEVYCQPLKRGGYFMRIIKILIFNYKVWQILRKIKTPIVVVNDMQALLHSFIGIKLYGCKLIFNIRDVYEKHLKYPVHWKLVNHCNQIIVLSDEMKETLLIRLPLKNKENWFSKITVINSVVNMKQFCPIGEKETQLLRTRNKINSELINIAFVASFNTKKNQLNFLKNFIEELKSESFHIHFIGDFDPINDSYAKECDTYIRENKLDDKITMYGYQSEVADFYRICDITVVPTKREGLARCMIESLACKTPVVSFDVCSAHEILTINNCGIVVEQGDYQRLKAEIFTLMKDKIRYQLYCENGWLLAHKLFATENIIDSYEKKFNELCQ